MNFDQRFQSALDAAVSRESLFDINELRKMFRFLDTDSDKLLTTRQTHRLLRLVGQQVDKIEDGDKLYTVEEIASLMVPEYANEMQSKVNFLWKLIDHYAANRVSKDQFRGFLNSCKIVYEEQDLNEMLESFGVEIEDEMYLNRDSLVGIIDKYGNQMHRTQEE